MTTVALTTGRFKYIFSLKKIPLKISELFSEIERKDILSFSMIQHDLILRCSSEVISRVEKGCVFSDFSRDTA